MASVTEETRRKVIIKCKCKCHFCSAEGKKVLRFGKRTVIFTTDTAIMDRIKEGFNYNGRDVQAFHFHHLKPLYFGGTHDEENIVLACPPCNLSAGHLSYIHKWMREHQG